MVIQMMVMAVVLNANLNSSISVDMAIPQILISDLNAQEGFLPIALTQDDGLNEGME